MTNKLSALTEKVTDRLEVMFFKLSKKSQLRLCKLALIIAIVTLPIWLIFLKSKEQCYFTEIKECYSNGEAQAFYNQMVQEFTEYQNKNTKLHKALE